MGNFFFFFFGKYVPFVIFFSLGLITKVKGKVFKNDIKVKPAKTSPDDETPPLTNSQVKITYFIIFVGII